jgi:hypothetical protein
MDPLLQDPLKLMAQVAALCSDLAMHEQALAIFQHLVVVRDHAAEALVALALAQSRAGAEPSAVATLEQALQRQPGHEMASVLLAIHLHERADPKGRALLQAVLDRGRDADAVALARSVADDVLTPAAAPAARPARHRYTRIETLG